MVEICKILLVDDDPDDRAIVKDALAKLNAANTICCAENGEVALGLLNDNANAIHSLCLIVLDLNMPKMNGTQTLKNLKSDKRFQHIPVIIYSTSINPLEKEKCMMLGAHSYITKPISYRESMDTAQLFLDLCNSKSFV
jgi:CheY-like chemotaxis protein